MSVKNKSSELSVRFDNDVYVKPEVRVDNCGRPNMYLRFHLRGPDNSCFFQGTWDNGLSRAWKIPGSNRGKLNDLHWVLFKWNDSMDFEQLPRHYRELISDSCFFFEQCLNEVMRQINKACYEETRKLREENEYLKGQIRCRSNNRKRRSKYVYLMKHSNGFVKIGFSTNPRAREKTLQAEDPRIEMLGFFAASNDVERKLHQIFADLRVRGEWFRLEERHVDWILTLKPQKAKARKRKSVAI